MKVKNIIGDIIEFEHGSIWSEKLIEIISIPNDTKYLWCSNNQLTSLPNLPKNLLYLSCENNNIKQLTNLTELQKLKEVICDICCFESYVLKMKNTHFTFYC
jgi:Leucine-rich repeat (LRR) protein